MLTNIFKLAAILSSIVLFSSCASHNQQTRIAENPELYSSLSENEKSSVQRGQISKGMHKKGVYLAWGNPSRSTKGNVAGKSYERWYYIDYTPTYTTGFYGGYGYSRYRYYGAYTTYRTDYVGEFEKKVEFRNDRVYSWESVK